MDSLICDESWHSDCFSPISTPDGDHIHNSIDEYQEGSFYKTKEDCEFTIMVFKGKELSYMPGPGYRDVLQSNKDLSFARSKSIHWLIKSRSRFNFSFVVLFNAINYLDRFLSANHHLLTTKGCRYWMLELLSVACLSVSLKFCHIETLSLQEIQMEDLEHSFQSVTIQRMELELLQTLDWRLNLTTAYSYVEILVTKIDFKPHFRLSLLLPRVTELLLGATLDYQMMEYRPSTLAVSALQCCFDELTLPKSDNHLTYITTLFDQDQKEKPLECYRTIKARVMTYPSYKTGCLVAVSCQQCPSSPVTVLLRERIDIYDHHVDLSLFKGSKTINLETNKKRKRKEI